MQKITIQHAAIGKRIDTFLAGYLKQVTRSFVSREIKNGRVLLNGKHIKSSTRLKDGDVVSFAINFKAIPTTTVSPQKNISFAVVYKNKDFLVINKPVGLQVHPSAAEKTHTLANALLAHFPEIKEVGDDPLRPGIVHRLDKNTSGLMIVARTQKSFEKLKDLFKERKMQKTYVALLHGNLKDQEGIIDTPLARAPRYTKQKIAEGKMRGKGRSAITLYRILKRYAHYDFVEAQPKTGRMHQIRVHFASLGHPIVGDTKYYTKVEKRMPVLAYRQLLHAQKLSFTLNGKKYSFEAPLPKDFQDILKRLL